MPNTTIQLKRSGSSSNTPTVLDFGELAINYTDGKLFYKHSNGTIVSFSSGGAGGDSFGTINANGTLVVSDTPGDVLNLVAGNNITFGVDAVNDIITINASGGGGDVSAPFEAANAAFLAANSAFANGNTNFTTLQAVYAATNAAFSNANTTHTLAIAAFTQANTANNLTVANTGTVVGSRNILNFIPGGNVTISFADDAVGNRVNVTISAAGGSGGGGSGALSYTSNVGNAVANTFNITHALNTTTIIPAVRERSTGYYVYPDMKVTSPNNIVLEFVSIPTANQYFLIVIGV